MVSKVEHEIRRAMLRAVKNDKLPIVVTYERKPGEINVLRIACNGPIIPEGFRWDSKITYLYPVPINALFVVYAEYRYDPRKGVNAVEIGLGMPTVVKLKRLRKPKIPFVPEIVPIAKFVFYYPKNMSAFAPETFSWLVTRIDAELRKALGDTLYSKFFLGNYTTLSNREIEALLEAFKKVVELLTTRMGYPSIGLKAERISYSQIRNANDIMKMIRERKKLVREYLRKVEEKTKKE